MIKLYDIETIRLSYRPSVSIDPRKCRLGSEETGYFAASIGVDWFKEAPDVLMVSVTSEGRPTVAWELSRELVAYALTNLGRQFGVGDMRVVAQRPSTLIASYRSDNWWHHHLPAGSVVELMRTAAKMASLELSGPKPYTHAAGRP